MNVRAEQKGGLRWLCRRVRRYIPVLAVLCLLSAAVSALSVSMSIFMATAIDAAADGNLHKMYVFLAIMAGVTLAGLGARTGMKLLQTRVQQRIEMLLRSSLIEGITCGDYAAVTAYHSGDLLNRITNDTSVVASSAAGILPQLCGMTAKLVLAFSVLCFFNPIFALVIVAAAVVVVLFSFLFRPLIKRLHKRMQEAEGSTRSFMQELIENLLAVKVFGAQRHMRNNVDALQDKHFAIAMRRRLISVVSGEGVSLVFTLGVLFALGWGTMSLAGVFGAENAITYGTLAAILQLVTQVQAPFATISGLFPQYFAMLASCERLMEIERLPEDAPILADGKVAEGFNSLDIRELCFSYGRETIFFNASAHIKSGDFIAVTGISGIGKSTLMKLILGVYHPDSGEIAIESNVGRRCADISTRGLFAYVPQGNLLLSGTVRDNIAFFQSGISDEEILRAAHIACADGFINAFPQGLDTVVGERGAGLSEGQAQRLAVARAVLTGAPVLLLDEATSALDAETERLMLSRLKLQPDRTVIIITHKSAALSVCDRELRIADRAIELV